MDEILNLIKAGKTPDQIYREAQAAAKKIEEEKQAAENKRKNRNKKKKEYEAARKDFLKAMIEYTKLVAGEGPDNRAINIFNKELSEIEDAVLDGDYPDMKIKINTEKINADKIIDEFLKDLGF